MAAPPTPTHRLAAPRGLPRNAVKRGAALRRLAHVCMHVHISSGSAAAALLPCCRQAVCHTAAVLVCQGAGVPLRLRCKTPAWQRTCLPKAARRAASARTAAAPGGPAQGWAAGLRQLQPAGCAGGPGLGASAQHAAQQRCQPPRPLRCCSCRSRLAPGWPTGCAGGWRAGATRTASPAMPGSRRRRRPASAAAYGRLVAAAGLAAVGASAGRELPTVNWRVAGHCCCDVGSGGGGCRQGLFWGWAVGLSARFAELSCGVQTAADLKHSLQSLCQAAWGSHGGHPNMQPTPLPQRSSLNLGAFKRTLCITRRSWCTPPGPTAVGGLPQLRRPASGRARAAQARWACGAIGGSRERPPPTGGTALRRTASGDGQEEEGLAGTAPAAAVG